MSSTLGHNLAQEKCTPPTRYIIEKGQRARGVTLPYNGQLWWLHYLLKNVRLQQLVHNSRDISAAGLNVCGIDAEFNSESIPHGPGGDG